MRLEKVIIQGFKSFYFRTEMSIHPGLTAVVGPNGAGKSNIEDAILWVMGEQSVKALRGVEMEEVISNGSKTLKPLGMAEVSLVFNISDQSTTFLDEKDSVITITRKLFRDGESKYILNGDESRLKDILDVLSRFHLAPKTYTIIEQNKIQMFLDSKPSERRVFFDDAAGISRYKHKKRETLSKLNAAENNLLRINDLIGEISQNRRMLKYQAFKARKHKALFEDLKLVKKNFFSAQFSLVSKSLLEVTNELDIVRKEVDAHNKKLFSTNAEIENLKHIIWQKEEKLGYYIKQINAIENSLSKLEKNSAILQNNIKNTRNDIASNADMLRGTEIKHNKSIELQQQAHVKLNEFALREKDVEDLNARISSLYELIKSISNKIKIDNDQVKQTFLSLNFEQINMRNHIAQAEKNLQRIRSSHSEAETLLTRIQHDLEGFQLDETQLQEMVNYEKMLTVMNESLMKNLENAHENLAKKIVGLSEKETGLQKTIAQIHVSMDHIEKFLSDEFAFRFSDEQISTLNTLPVSFHGVLIELIQIPEQYLKLINFIYKDLLFALVANSENDAKILSQHLISHNRPFAIICYSLLKKGYQMKIEADRLTSLSEIINSADELISLKSIFDNVYIINDKEMISQQAFENNKYYYYPPEELLFYNGIFIRLEKLTQEKNALSLHNEKSRLKELEYKIHEQLREVADQQIVCEQKNARILQMIDSLENAGKHLLEINTNSVNLLNSVRIDINNLSYRRESIDNEKIQFEMQEKEFMKEIEATQMDCTGCEQKQQIIEHESRQLEELSFSYNELAQTYGTRLETARIYKVQIKEKSEALKTELKRIMEETQELIATSERIKLMIDDNKKLIERYNAGIEKINHESETLIKEKNNAKDCYSTLEIEKNEMKSKINALEVLYKKILIDKDKLVETEHSIDVKRTELTSECAHIKENCLKETNFQAEYQESADETHLQSLSIEIGNYENKLQRIGAVNELAIDEFENINKKYEFLQNQQIDIKNSMETLKKAIEKLDSFMKDKLNDAILHINRYFKEYFDLIFRGGNVELYFENPEDILESGININIKIPQKRALSFNLLSGGEKSLISLLLLFSIFKYKPSFFCVWDEIDAALDDINVMKIIEIINDLKKNIQFVLITHNKVMMEAADQLYGITMEEAGISKLLSVKIANINDDSTIAV